MAQEYVLAAQLRDMSVTPRALRRAQWVPGIVYGRDYAATSVQIEAASLTRLVQRAGTSTLVSLSVEGQSTPYSVLIREVQRDPVTSRILHVDFVAVSANEVIRNAVPLVQRGTSPMEQNGAIILQTLDELMIECLPKDMPHAIHVDIARLTSMDSRLTVADLEIPEGVTVLTPDHTDVVMVTAPMRAGAEEAEAGEAAAEEASGEESAG